MIVYKNTSEPPFVVSLTAFLAPNHSAYSIDKITTFYKLRKSFRKTSEGNHDLSVVRKPVRVGVGLIVIGGAVIFHPLNSHYRKYC